MKTFEEVTLCAGKKCCPVVRFFSDGAGARIQDDDHDQVILTHGELLALRDELNRRFPSKPGV
jgi:hypothetical protein